MVEIPFYQTRSKERLIFKRKRNSFFLDAGVFLWGLKVLERGPSIMPGEIKKPNQACEADLLKQFLQNTRSGTPVCLPCDPKISWNYVKMVHNGLKYSMMQLTSEILWFLIEEGPGAYRMVNFTKLFTCDSERASISFFGGDHSRDFCPKGFTSRGDFGGFDFWIKPSKKELEKWTSQCDGSRNPVPTNRYAVSMREIFRFERERLLAMSWFRGPKTSGNCLKEDMIAKAEQGLYFFLYLSYAQGLHQLGSCSHWICMSWIWQLLPKSGELDVSSEQDVLADIADAFTPQNLIWGKLAVITCFCGKSSGDTVEMLGL